MHYPKWVYPKDGSAPFIVESPEEHEAHGDAVAESPETVNLETGTDDAGMKRRGRPRKSE